MRRGWGSGELSLDFDGGVLKSVADTADALGALVSAAADVEKAGCADRPEGAAPGHPPDPENPPDP